MRIRLLGTGAGGGVPQWNCACRVCSAARAGQIPRRTQASAAVSADGERWLLLHASPDVRPQIESFAPLQPRAARDTPIAGVALANGDLDACLGLFELRESQPFQVLATRAVARGIREENALARTLERTPDQVSWRQLALGHEIEIAGLKVTAFAMPGKVPIHLQDRVAPSAEDNVALRVIDRAGGDALVWAPSVAGPTPGLETLLAEARCVLFDGTFWSLGELRGAPRMGHWPLAQSIALLSRIPARTILVHINNTNPILLPDSAERAAVRSAGVEIGEDGMELTL